MNSKHALIAMSGGVDSSVAAYLVKQWGYLCSGSTMLLHSGLQNPDIAASVRDAEHVAASLDIPFYIMDMQEIFHREVMDHFVTSYEEGLTPNPCIVCNQKLKFGVLLEKALALGCTHLVTGHYARVTQDGVNGRYILKKAADIPKDQSYFLYSLTQEQLRHILFPLGELSKDQARKIAEEQGFVNARKRDSQDICFIPDGDYFHFLRRHTGVEYPQGNFLDLSGNVVGQHKGAVAYTLGQRKGLGLAMGSPVYVCNKDMQKNTVTVGPNEALFSTTLTARCANWIAIPDLTEPIRVKAKARSRMAEQPATVYPAHNGSFRVVFDEPQRAITPGQAIVLYDGETVVGGGEILSIP